MLSFPIAIAIAVLIAIVVSSYRQTILAYPQGGGSYVVTRENLGRYPSLVAGAALLVDYVLTVAVSVAAGIAAITSAIRPLYPYRVTLCVLGVAAHRRREPPRRARVRPALRAAHLPVPRRLLPVDRLGRVPVAPRCGDWPVPPVPAEGAEAADGLPGPPRLLVRVRRDDRDRGRLRRRAGVPGARGADRPPRLLALGGILIVLFLGISALAHAFGVVPAEGETVISQLARLVFGASPLYYFIQGVTMLILILAANTSFADFPRLALFLARDRSSRASSPTGRPPRVLERDHHSLVPLDRAARRSSTATRMR